jgi:hypothetical protein
MGISNLKIIQEAITQNIPLKTISKKITSIEEIILGKPLIYIKDYQSSPVPQI